MILSPRDIPTNRLYRAWLLGRARANKRVRDALKERCANDLLFYVNSFVWTFDPRTPLKFLPFVTWPIQDRAFKEIIDSIEFPNPDGWNGRDLVIEKSRDMGASWMCLVVMEWMWHFKPGTSFLMVSRKEGLVDASGDPDSLFWKVDFIHQHLPDWLRPAIDRRRLHFGNFGNGSTIDGESTTSAAGVGGRRTAMFIDEFSRIEEGYQLLAGTADTTRCRIFNFTPWGTSNAAYKLAKRTDVRKLRLHWSEHPEKARGLYRYNPETVKVEVKDKTYHFAHDFNFVMDGKLRSPWYDEQCRRRANDREVAQMLDIDYQGSAYQFFDKAMIVELQQMFTLPAYWEGDIAFDPATGKPLDLVPGKGGPLKLWCHLDAHGHFPVGSYGAGVDLSTGTGATNSCLSGINVDTGEKVLEYTSPYLRPEQMAQRAVALCWLLKDHNGEGMRLAWEHAGPGVGFAKRVIELGYGNIYHREPNIVYPGYKASDAPGWYPGNEAKMLLLSEYRSALAGRRFINRSWIALEECLQFIHTTKGTVEHSEESGGDDPTGARSNHGDRVIADALAWKMAEGHSPKALKPTGEILPGSLAWRRQLRDNRRKAEEA